MTTTTSDNPAPNAPPSKSAPGARENTASEFGARQRWMSVLARAHVGALSALWESLPTKPAWAVIRAPEIGMVMTRGRIGGTGNRFNLGEMTVTRCAVRLEDGTTGLSFVAGRDKRHAEIAAVVDALMQAPDREAALEDAIITPLERWMTDKREARSRKAAATKVEFFTMVRGD